MAPVNRRADLYLLYLPLLVLVGIYSGVTGEWWAVASAAGAVVGVSLMVPIDDYYGGATAHVGRLVLALDHLLALGLLVLLLLRAPGIFDGSHVMGVLWIALVAGLVAYFVRAGEAWRRFRHRGAPG